MNGKPVLKIVAAASNDSHVRPGMLAAHPWIGTAARGVGRFVLNTLIVALMGLKAAVFFPLMWLHGFVSVICNGVAMLGIFAVVLGWLFGASGSIVWKIALFSFVFFMLQWVYTGIVLALAPGSMALDGRFNDRRPSGE